MHGRRFFRVLTLVPLLAAAVALSSAQAAAAASIKVTVSPTSVAAGSTFTVKATAVDSLGNTLTSYSGTGTWSDLSGGLTPGAPLDFVNGISTTKARVAAPYKADTITVSSGGMSGTTKAFSVFGPLDHIALSGPGTPTAGATFKLTATAQDALNQTVANYSGTAVWSDLSGFLSPSTPAAFAKGISKTTTAMIPIPAHADTITLSSGGKSATTAPFNVFGPPNHIAVTAPSLVSAPRFFAVTATMEDSANNVLTSYAGPATWSDLSGTLTPSTPVNFVKGVSKNSNLRIFVAVNPNQITVQSGGVSGTSNQFDMPIITSSAETARPGGTINIAGSGWPASKPVWIDLLDNSTVTTIQFCVLRSDASGNVPTHACTIPPTISPADSYQLAASNGSDLNISWVDPSPFTVLNPKASWSGSSAYAGAQLAVSGTGFAHDSSLTVTLTDASNQSTTLPTNPASPASDDTGGFTVTFTIPGSTAPGSYTLNVTDASGNTQSESLTVLPPPSITTSSETGAPTQTINLGGSQWEANAPVNVSLHDDTTGSDNAICTLTADAAGNLPSTSCALPQVPAGDTYRLTASEPGNPAAKWTDSNTFALAQLAVWSSSSAAPGGTLTVSGYGFAANSSVTVNLIDSGNSSTTLSSGSLTDATGSFGSISFTIPPSQPSGSYTLQVIDASGHSATEGLTIP
jgi:hypothetical protein